MRAEAHRAVGHPVEAVWQAVSDVTGYPEFVPGCRTVEGIRGPSGRGTQRGAQYAYRVDAGSTPLGGTVELVTYEPAHELAWTSVTGLEFRGRWRLRQLDDARTQVELRVSYRPRGGALGLLTDRVVALFVQRRLEETLQRLDDLLAGVRSPETAPSAGLREQAGSVLQGAWALARSGLLAPVRPDRVAGQLAALTRWGLNTAGAYASAAAAAPDRPAVIDERGTLTYAELDERTTRLAWSLAAYGVGTRARMGLLGRNHRGLVESIVAGAKLGADTVLLNTGLSAVQLPAVLDEQGIDLVVADAEFRPLLEQVPGRVRQLTAWADGPVRGATLEGLIAEGPSRALTPPETSGRTVVLTSGTTGTPKGAPRPAPPGLAPLTTVLSRIPLRAGGRILVAAPLFHTWGYGAAQLAMALRSTIVLQRRFDPEATLRAVEEHGCTALFAVPVMLQRILDLPEETRRGIDTSSLRVVVSSGSALSGGLATRFMDCFGDVLYNVYGSTEVSWATIATPTDLRAAPGTAGRPPRDTTVAILGDGGEPVPRGATGEIYVGNEMLFEGYTGGGTKNTRDGLMSTGDLGHFDTSGLLFLDGRTDDMIVSGGENVFPSEVESLLAALPQVREVAVIGVPDEDLGERLAAYLVLRPGQHVDADAVRAQVRAHLARFAVPRDVVFVDELPRTATGKVWAAELRSRRETS